MPSVSKKQHNLMAAAAHNPAFAKKVGVPTSVAKEFNAADKGKKFSRGGEMDKKDLSQDKKMVKKAVKMHDDQLHGGKKTNLTGLKKGGKVKKYEDGGLTFADMSDEDRAAQAKARIAEMGGPMPETPKRKAKAVDKGDTRENLRDLDMQGADTGYDATERARNAKKTQTRHYSGRPGASAEPQVFTPKRKSALPSEQKGMGTFKSGGTVSASRRGDGCAQRGKTKGRMI